MIQGWNTLKRKINVKYTPVSKYWAKLEKLEKSKLKLWKAPEKIIQTCMHWFWCLDQQWNLFQQKRMHCIHKTWNQRKKQYQSWMIVQKIWFSTLLKFETKERSSTSQNRLYICFFSTKSSDNCWKIQLLEISERL